MLFLSLNAFTVHLPRSPGGIARIHPGRDGIWLLHPCKGGMRPEWAVIAGDTKRQKGVLYPCVEPGAPSVISNFTPYDPGLAGIV